MPEVSDTSSGTYGGKPYGDTEDDGEGFKDDDDYDVDDKCDDLISI